MNRLEKRDSRCLAPLSVGKIHFVGIGGIGMSGIADILHHLGYEVQGSDQADNANVKRLRAQGVKIFVGHEAAHIEGAGVVVISSAVKADNPEVKAARGKRIPVIRRAEMLGELMRLKWAVAVAGTHGKTTTTSLVASLFEAAGLDPTVINGGVINEYGTNARLGEGDWLVAESDESDGSFTKLPATIGIVTNIDPEHLDHYGSFEAEKDAFLTFVQNLPFYGFGVLCVDHPVVQDLLAKIEDRRIVTYGFSPQAEVRALNLQMKRDGAYYDVCFTKDGKPTTIKDFHLPVIGQHNVLNSLAALAVAFELSMSEDVMREALARFQGVKRRFTRTGVVRGVTIVDDYGHHPTEIAATLKAALQAKEGKGRILAVMQPHRYSRLSSLFNEFCTCFNDADTVFVSEVYPAGEAPIQGADRDALVEGLKKHGHHDARALPSPDDLATIIAEIAKPDDFVICLGAGSISAWANALPGALEAIWGKEG